MVKVIKNDLVYWNALCTVEFKELTVTLNCEEIAYAKLSDDKDTIKHTTENLIPRSHSNGWLVKK